MGRAEAEALGSRPSQDRGTTTSAKFSKRWELSSLLLLLLLSNSSFHASSGHSKATAFNFSYFGHGDRLASASSCSLFTFTCLFNVNNTNVNRPELLAPFFTPDEIKLVQVISFRTGVIPSREKERSHYARSKLSNLIN